MVAKPAYTVGASRKGFTQPKEWYAQRGRLQKADKPDTSLVMTVERIQWSGAETA